MFKISAHILQLGAVAVTFGFIGAFIGSNNNNNVNQNQQQQPSDGAVVVDQQERRQLRSLSDPVSITSKAFESQVVTATKVVTKMTMADMCDYGWEMKGPETHYNDDYFKWQKEVGAKTGALIAGAWSDAFDMTNKVVADIGCGGGFAVSKLTQASRRYCFEINPAAIAAHPSNVVSVPRWSEMPDDEVDNMFSNHSFEHHPHPLMSLQCAMTKLKPGSGVMHLEVPFEHGGCNVEGNDENNHYGQYFDVPNTSFHIYTWSPRNLGQLMHAAGFVDIECSDLRGLDTSLFVDHQFHTKSVWCRGRRPE